MLQMKKVHFIGIGGSGISACAMLAYNMGWQVSGCDLQADTPYLKSIKAVGIRVDIGQSKEHIASDLDCIATTPALFFLNNDHPETVAAREIKKLVTWEEFLGNKLMKEKKTIAIAGTHGKSTTTALLALILEEAKKDPSVMIGAKVPKWDANYRYGKSELFVVEADEFYNNFLHYNPDVIILNNIEFDHPDFFENEEKVFEAFANFIKKLKGEKKLIVNQDSEGIKKLFDRIGTFQDSLKVYGYTFLDNPVLKFPNSTKIAIIKRNESESTFSVSSDSLNFTESYTLKIPGDYNIANAAGAILFSKLYTISHAVIKKVLPSFNGIGRRLEYVGEFSKVKIYDDYAHHPTAIAATLSALRQKYPKNRIWAVVEPHTFSRTKALLALYENVFSLADKVLIAPIFKSRDKQTFGITQKSIIDVAKHPDIISFENSVMIVDYLKKHCQKDDVVLVMGAGESYKIARDLVT